MPAFRVRRFAIVTAAIAIAIAPALTGLRGNESFAQSVPVLTPPQAHAVAIHGFPAVLPKPKAAVDSPARQDRHDDSVTPSATPDDKGGARSDDSGGDRHGGGPGHGGRQRS